MLRHVKKTLSQFSQSYNLALFSHDKPAIQRCLRILERADKFPARAAKWLLQTFHAGRVDIIRGLAKAEGVIA
jgi:hypothetical protein